MLLDDNIDNDVCGVGGSIIYKNIKVLQHYNTVRESIG